MDDAEGEGEGWFARVASGEDVREAIEAGSADAPADWPARAVEAGFAADRAAYYDRLHDATVTAARGAARERERADDRQLIHAVRAMGE